MSFITRFANKIDPLWPLRLGLGLMYIYSGYDLMIHPTAWHWALPYWLRGVITQFIPLEGYLRIQGALEIGMALVLLAWFLRSAVVKWVALLSVLEFAAILILAFAPFSEANFLITFRDIGLLGASSALLILLFREGGNGGNQQI